MVTIWCHYRDWKLAVFSTPSIDIFFYDKTRHKWPSSLVSLPPLHLKIAVPIYIDKKIYRAERYHISIMVIHFPHFLIFYDSASSIRSFYKLFWCWCLHVYVFAMEFLNTIKPHIWWPQKGQSLQNGTQYLVIIPL